MKFDDMTSLRVFKLVYETRSLTKTSEKMGLSKAAVSKRLEGLELALGRKLFVRSTRLITPTTHTEQLILQVNEIFARIDGLQASLENQAETQKKVRVTCFSILSQRFLGELLQKFQENHPMISIDLIVTDSVLDLTEHGIDLAFRVNPSKQSNLIGRRVGDYKLVVVASPAYLKGQKKLKSISDLTSHKLFFLDSHSGAFRTCSKDLQRDLSLMRTFSTNDSPLITQLLLQGRGVGLRTQWDVQGYLNDKKLTLALPANTFKSQGDLWLLAPADRLKSEVVRKLYDYLIHELVEEGQA